ncbi:MAG: D-aminoacylase [Bryobacteraceae bacterium]|nr:D-aminoacylase [Bryobacteraceae bacterium]
MRVALLFLLAALSAPAQYDILIRNARVIDGTGNPWFHSSIAIREGRIAAIGRLEGATAKRVIDAGGRVAAPGFIDVHTHVEGAIEKVPRADNFLLDGVTTIVTGNCGGSAQNVAAWFQRLEELGVGVNVATLIGHNTVRRQVMGTENRHATPEELARMKELVHAAMQQGAVGFSTGLIYIPGAYAPTEEVVELAKSAAVYDGVYASHMRDEGAQILDAIHEAARVGEQAGMPVQISHFKIDTPRIWGFSEKSIALVEEYRRRGVDVVVDQYPYDHASTNLGITLPAWALAGGTDALRERLSNPETRSRIVAEMQQRLKDLGHPDFSYATVAYFEKDHSWEGRNIAEITRLRGLEPTIANQIETIFHILLNGGAQMIYHSMGDVDIERILRYPNTAIASDGGVRVFGEGMPHPRSYGTNARVLAEYVRRRGILTLEDAIRRMTSLPARTFRFRDRGLLREGFAADIVVFDPARVQDKATYTRPHQYSEGFDYVLVNGVVMVEEGRLTDARGGRILRHRSGTVQP